MKNLIIFDLDGCLLSSLHRYKTDTSGKAIDLQHWRENSTPEKIARDTPTKLAQTIYKEALKDKNTLVAIGTARIVCSTTLQVIREKIGAPDLILGRESESDTRSGAYFKTKIVELFTFKDFDSLHFFDDNLDYIRQFKEAHPCAVVHHIKSKQGH